MQQESLVLKPIRATAATRLYESGIDEQLVLERIGHRSLPGVRSYKRTSSHQKEVLSDILNKVPRLTNAGTAYDFSSTSSYKSGPSALNISAHETPSISLLSLTSNHNGDAIMCPLTSCLIDYPIPPVFTIPCTATSNLSNTHPSSKSPAKSTSIQETSNILPTPNSSTSMTNPYTPKCY